MKHVALIVFALSFPAAAMAGDFRFAYSPQALSSPEGVEKLHSKLEMAANRYCRDRYITLNMRGVEQCSRELVDQTVDRIGNARLAAFQAGRSDRSS